MRIYHAGCIGQEFNCLYPHAADITDAPSLAAAVRRDYVCAEYKGSYRSNDNFLRSDCLAADFDNDHSEDPADWVKPEDILSAFPGVAVGFHFSRHYLKPKDSFSARTRFHVLLSIEPVTDQAEYAAMKKQLAVFFPQVDPKALDAARFFFGTENPVVEFHPGDKKLNDYLSDFDAGMAKGTYGDRVIKEGSRNATLSRFGGRLAMRFGWNDLAHAVVVQAVKDFKNAYKALRKHPDRKEQMKEVREITKFFASEYFESLFDLDGPALLRKVKEELDDRPA